MRAWHVRAEAQDRAHRWPGGAVLERIGGREAPSSNASAAPCKQLFVAATPRPPTKQLDFGFSFVGCREIILLDEVADLELFLVAFVSCCVLFFFDILEMDSYIYLDSFQRLMKYLFGKNFEATIDWD